MPRRSRRRIRRSSRRMPARSRRSGGSKPMFSLGSMKIYQSDLWEMLGVASAGTIGGFANQVSGGRLTGNVAQSVGALGLAFLGGRRGGNVAEGVVKKTVGDFAEDNVIPRIFGAFNSGSNSTSTPSNSVGGFTVVN